MSAPPIPIPLSRPIALDTSAATSSSSFWDNITTWASEHKAVVYTIAGVTIVVTGVGVAYYLSDPSSSQKSQDSGTSKKKSKKSKGKSRKAAGEASKEATQESSAARGQYSVLGSRPGC